METAIVTVRNRDRQFECDMELPVDLPVSVLEGKLLGTLRDLDCRTFPSTAGFSLYCGGVLLDRKKTLNELEIWDGSIITVR